jgi:hypothetical protein
MSIVIDVLSAARILATAKTAIAPRSAGLRPQMSLHFAHMGPEAAFARRYALPTQVYPAADWRLAEMVGMAVAMMV